MILKGKTTSVKKHSSKSKRAKKNAKMEKTSKDNTQKGGQEHTICKDINPKDCQDRTCPLCITKLDLQDYNFYPCQCGYQICGFCWHKIRTEGNSLCPNCRRTYTENPDCYKPLSQEVVQKLKKEQKQKELQKKKEQIESRKQLANVRVVQKNLVFVHGLPQNIDQSPGYRKLQQTFKDFGPVVKCVVNNKTNYAGSQIPRASVYVTYQRIEDALKAYKSLPSKIEDHDVKTSLGTTKYCSNFLKNAHCPKQDCMYLHELADEELCFTKDQIHNGEHLEFGDQLYEKMVNHSSSRSPQASQPKELVPTQNEQEEVLSKLNSLQIKDPVSTSAPSPRPSFPSEPTFQQSKLQQLFSSSSKDSTNQVNGIDGSSASSFSKAFEEYRSKFIPSFAETPTIDDSSIQKSLVEENTVNTPPRPVLNSENFIRPELLNSTHKEMWPDQRRSVNLYNDPIKDCLQIRVNPTSQALQGLNHEDGPFYQRSQSPEIPDDDLGFDPIAISISNLSNIIENSQQSQPIRRDLGWPPQMSEQQSLQNKLQNMHRLKNPPPGFLVNHVQQNQPLQSPVYNNPDTSTNVLINRMSPPPAPYPSNQHIRNSERAARFHQLSRVPPINGNPLMNRMSPLINASNNFLRTNYPRFPQSNMALSGIPSMNGFTSQSHRNIAVPPNIPLQAQAMQEMLARSVNNTQHIQTQSQNLSNHMPFAHLEQNLSPSLWNVNQTSINQSQWMQAENSFPGQNLQDFRPASPSLISRRVPPQLRPEFPRQLTQQHLARFNNPPTYNDNPQYLFPNGQFNQLTNGVPTFP